MADANDDDTRDPERTRAPERRHELTVDRKARYESFGWSFSGGLLATGHVRGALERLTVVVTNAVAFFGKTAMSAKQKQRRTKEHDEGE